MAKSQLQPEQLIEMLAVLPSGLRRKVFNDILSKPIDLEMNQLPPSAHEPIEMECTIPTLTEVYKVA